MASESHRPALERLGGRVAKYFFPYTLPSNLNIYPINIMFHGAGVVGWTIAGFLSKDKAILTNFGLQIPLFMIGIYQVVFQ